MNYLSNEQYLAIKPESVSGTAVVPDIFVPLVSESISSQLNYTVDKRIKGLEWNSDDLLRGNRSHEGEIVILADPDNIGHFFNMFFNKETTTGDATDGYTHPFTVGDSDSYTIEISRGLYSERYFGVKFNQITLDFSNGDLQIRANIRARGQFSVSKLGVALSGAVTAIVLNDSYDLNPTDGLVVGDTLVIGSDEIVITGITDGKTVEFASTSLTYSIDETIYLKTQTPSYTGLQDPFHQGNISVGLGADESTSTTNAGSESTATPIHDLSITFTNNIFETPRTGSIDPVEIKTKNKEAQIQLKQLLENENQRGDYLNRTEQALTLIATGKHIKSDFTTSEKLTMKFYKVKLTSNNTPLEVDEYIIENQDFEVLYDNSNSKALDIELVNRTAGTDY